MANPMEQEVWKALETMIDPELGCNIVALGLVYDVRVEEGRAKIEMTLTTPGCPMHGVMVDGVTEIVGALPDINEVAVNLVWEPPWNAGMMSLELQRKFLGTKES